VAITGTDISVAVNGDIRWTGGATPNYTVLELHRFLQDLADQAQASGDDLVDITSDTPSERSTDGIITLLGSYNIDDDMAEHLYAGSITQGGGDIVYSGLQVLGAVNTAATQLMVMQDNDKYYFTTTPADPFWGTQATGGYNGDAASGVLMRCLIKSRDNGADINGKRIRVQARHWEDTYDFFDVTLGLGESVAAIGTTPDAQNDSTQGVVTLYADVLNSGGSADAPTGGYQLVDLNNSNGDQPYYSQWTFGGQGDGLKALWEYTKDLTGNGTTKTNDGIAGEIFLGITHELDYLGQGTNFQEREVVCWGTKVTYKTLASGPFTVGNYVIFETSGAVGRVMDDDGTDTLIVALENTSVTIQDEEVITEYPGPGAGATTTTAAVEEAVTPVEDNDKSGGSGVILAMLDSGATGTLWLQLISGSAPVDTLPLLGNTSNGDGDTDGAPTTRTIPKIFTGSYTGSYIGSFGLGIDPDDLTATDSIQDLLGATQEPPNNVSFTVTGLADGEDRVLVGPRALGILEKDQDTHTALLTDGVTTSVVMLTAIPTDTPTSGVIRIQDNNGVYVSIPYASYTGSTYTLTGTFEGSDDSNADADTEVFIGYIDEIASGSTASFTSVFLSTRDLFVRVRDGGISPIKTFESTAAQLTATGGTVAAIRTEDD